VQHEEIENRIRTRIGEDPRTMHLAHLNVEVNDDVADIRGQATSEEEKRAVGEITEQIEGVREVRNLITVNPDAPTRGDKAAGQDLPPPRDQ
jgi:osmotically-inducible protein OsmY